MAIEITSTITLEDDELHFEFSRAGAPGAGRTSTKFPARCGCAMCWETSSQGRRYTEQEVSEMLERYHEDYAYMRRQLVEHGFMALEGGGDYWLKV